MKDLEYFYQTHVNLIKQRFANPNSYSEEIYYNQKEKYDKLFQFTIQHQDDPILVDNLQETMQALKLCKDTIKSFTKVEELLDGDTEAYLKELHIQVDDIFVTLETWSKELALEKVNKLAAWDEVKMQELTHSSKPVSGAIIELIQIHDHIHGALRSLVEWKM